MAEETSETRNARGEVVEWDEDKQAWVPKDSEQKDEVAETHDPVPVEGEVLEDKGARAPSRTTDKDSE